MRNLWLTTAACAALTLAPTLGMAVAADVPATVPAATPAVGAYILQPGDVLMVSVWKEPELNLEVLVRPDGGISLPLAGDVAAAGHSAEEVRSVIDARLRKFIPDPVVTVSVKSATGNEIFVIGKVNHPGQYQMLRPLDVMQALSLASGTTAFAALNSIHVLRRESGKQVSIPFHYTEVQNGRRLEQNILLRGGDTVVVP
jgi:polysaccharide biosynthesis/export protein